MSKRRSSNNKYIYRICICIGSKMCMITSLFWLENWLILIIASFLFMNKIYAQVTFAEILQIKVHFDFHENILLCNIPKALFSIILAIKLFFYKMLIIFKSWKLFRPTPTCICFVFLNCRHFLYNKFSPVTPFFPPFKWTMYN